MESISLLWESLWQGPKIGGMVFAILLLAALFVSRAIIARRNRRNKVACRAQSEDRCAKCKMMKREPKRTDKSFHVSANTMPLGVSKLVRTGSPYDKGVMS